MVERGYRVGEVARRAGVSVRALHHYERIGLLVPGVRTGAGHRVYGGRDIEKLVRIVVLKRLGLSLTEIGACLGKRGFGLRRVLERQLEALRRRITAEQDLCGRLEGILRLMSGARALGAEEFFSVMEMMHMTEGYYTAEQLEAIKKRGAAMGEEKLREAEWEWPELIRKVQAEMEAGTDPGDAKVQALARRWKELVESFTGGDPGIAASLGKLWKERGPEMAGKMGMGFDPKVFEYVRRAWAG